MDMPAAEEVPMDIPAAEEVPWLLMKQCLGGNSHINVLVAYNRLKVKFSIIINA